MPPVIKLEGFSKTYYTGEIEVHAVRSVSLEIQPGAFVAIMLFVGTFQISSWPFKNYPSFSSIKGVQAEKLEATVREPDGTSRPARYPR